MRWKHPVTVLLLISVLLLAPLPLGPLMLRWPAITHTAEDSAHPLVFWWLVSTMWPVVRARLPSAMSYAAMLLLALVIALGTEYVQSLVGRDASWEDARHDMLGALFALLLQARKDLHPTGRTRWRHAAGVGAVLITLLAAFPLAWTAVAYAGRSEAFPLLWSSDALWPRRFSFWKQDNYARLVIEEPARDWRGYAALEVRARSLRREGTQIRIRVHDMKHNFEFLDRYDVPFVLAGDSEHIIRIPLEEIRHGPAARELDLAAVRAVIVFQGSAGEPPRFSVREILLVR